MSSAWSLVFDPLTPTPLFWLVAALAIAPCLYLALGGARGWPLRVAAIAVLVLTLAGPRLGQERREALPDVVLVLSDHSPSQELTGRGAQVEAVEEAVASAIEALGDARIERRRIDADDAALGAALADAWSEVDPERVAGAVLITDGRSAESAEALEALAPDGPVHVLLTGETDIPDRALEILAAPSYGVVGEVQEVELIVRDEDAPAGTMIDVVAQRDGAPFAVVEAPANEPFLWTFEADRAGSTVFDFRASPRPGEISLANNRAAMSVNFVRDRLRVLLVSGQPHAGLRVWRNLLKSDPAVDLVHFTILRPPEKQDGTPIDELALIAFPARELFEEKLQEFDLVIFDRYERRGLLPTSYFLNVALYVEGGGALLATSGPEFADALSIYRTPLSAVLPAGPTGEVIERPVTPILTERGLKHPVTGALAPALGDDGAPLWGPWLRQIAADPDAGALMAGAGDRPLLLLDRVGRGRVAQLLSDQAWLWAKDYEGGGPYAALLRRLVHWLMAEPELEEERLDVRVVGDVLAIERRSLDREEVEIVIEAPSGGRETETLAFDERGRAMMRIEAGERGLYRISDGERAALAAPNPIRPQELRQLSASAEPLRPLVEASGGAIVELAAGVEPPLFRKIDPGDGAFGRTWLGVEARGAHRVVGIASTPIPPAWLGLALAASLLALAWWREGAS